MLTTEEKAHRYEHDNSRAFAYIDQACLEEILNNFTGRLMAGQLAELRMQEKI